jgi:hypothetical protein
MSMSQKPLVLFPEPCLIIVNIHPEHYELQLTSFLIRSPGLYPVKKIEKLFRVWKHNMGGPHTLCK